MTTMKVNCLLVKTKVLIWAGTLRAFLSMQISLASDSGMTFHDNFEGKLPTRENKSPLRGHMVTDISTDLCLQSK